MKPQIKICGITNLIDAKNALQLGADYIGFNNISGTTRYLTCKEIDEITANLNAEEKAKVVLLTDFDAADSLISLASNLQINIIQPYASLSSKDLVSMKSLGFQIFMPRAVASEDDIKDLDSYKHAVNLIILDSKSSTALGGTGKTFDHDLFRLARRYTNLPLGLAGGLNPDNVQDIVAQTQPELVDISSGLESQVRIKSLSLMRKFIELLRLFVLGFFTYFSA